MIITLEGTTSAKISAELVRVRQSAGSPAQSMVLTLIIVCDESEFPSALEASMAAEALIESSRPRRTVRMVSICMGSPVIELCRVDVISRV